MSFVIGWLWYLLAFLAGSLVAYGAAIALVKPAPTQSGSSADD